MTTSLTDAPLLSSSRFTDDKGAAAELLEIVLAATNEGIVEWWLDTDEIKYSDRWKAILGFEPHQVVDSVEVWRDLTHPQDRAEVQASIREHVEGFWPLDRLVRMRHSNGN